MKRELEDMQTVDDGSLSPMAHGSTHEVFLSFRGPDIRRNFTDHLYNCLTEVGVETFRDNENLHVGEEIGPKLRKAIEESSILIPIFSKGYASSKWCLREVTHMVKHMNDEDPDGRLRHTVCPIFYDVTPEEVKRQTGSFEQAFLQHKGMFDELIVQEWKDALEKVCKLRGLEKYRIVDGHEGAFTWKIVREVCEKLKKGHVRLTDDLIGMDHHTEEMTKLLDSGSNDVRIVGIVGMGGIGKTIIAKFMYNKLCGQFRNQCSFLEDVRETVKLNGYAEVRRQLIYDRITIEKSAKKKVLLVLDDVEDRSQLEKIIGGLEFGSGSRIIVTTRNTEVFKGRDLIYAPKKMKFEDSLQLFCKYAFGSTQPEKGFEDISSVVAEIVAGLPLSLVVIGSMLYSKKSLEYWEATLNKLIKIPAHKVQERLKISYDVLTHNQQQMFLDIACHFIGQDITHAIHMWEACGLFPKGCEGIDVLVSQSLITIEKEKQQDAFKYGEVYVDTFRMHDQLRDMGRGIVYLESTSDPGQRSRLWSHEAVDTLNSQSGKEKVQTLQIVRWKWDPLELFYCFSNHDFKEMSKLRYFHLEGDSNLKGDFKGLLPELRWFKWRKSNPHRWDKPSLIRTVLTIFFPRMAWTNFYPPLVVANFCPRKLVILDLSNSHISDDWESSIQIKSLTNLKVLNLSHCGGLTKTPDFSALSMLERLNLEECYSLTEIGSSVKHLKRLTYFNAKFCLRLTKLPPEFALMVSLQKVHLDDCYRFSELPESIGSLTELRYLLLHGCVSLVKIPESICNLKSLVELDISETGITEISKSIGMRGDIPSGIRSGLTSLRVLNLNCTGVNRLPDDVGGLFNLRELTLCGAKIKELSGVRIESLQKLEVLDCSGCKSLKGQLPEGIGRLSSLEVLNLSQTEITGGLPKDISGLSNLEIFDLEKCKNFRLPTEELKFPLSLTELYIPLTKASLDVIKGLVNLRKLTLNKNVAYCCKPMEEDVEGVDMPSSLEHLILDGSDDNDMGCILLPAMKFDSSSRVEYLDVESCKFGTLPTDSLDLSNCQMLRILHISNSHEIKGLEVLTSLEELTVYGCPHFMTPDLSNYHMLKKANINGCEVVSSSCI